MNNELKIQCPDNHVIDVENSDLSAGIIRFKPKPMSFEVERVGNGETYYTVEGHKMEEDYHSVDDGYARSYNYYHTKEEAGVVREFQTANRKLLRLANALNPKGWVPSGDFDDFDNIKYSIDSQNRVSTSSLYPLPGRIYFHSKEACQTAIDQMTADELAALRIQQIYPR